MSTSAPVDVAFPGVHCDPMKGEGPFLKHLSMRVLWFPGIKLNPSEARAWTTTYQVLRQSAYR